MDSRRLAYLAALEIDVWERRDVGTSGAVTSPSREAPPTSLAVAAPAPAADDVAALGWEELTARVRG